jgi:hypothetical protein
MEEQQLYFRPRPARIRNFCAPVMKAIMNSTAINTIIDIIDISNQGHRGPHGNYSQGHHSNTDIILVKVAIGIKDVTVFTVSKEAVKISISL